MLLSCCLFSWVCVVLGCILLNTSFLLLQHLETNRSQMQWQPKWCELYQRKFPTPASVFRWFSILKYRMGQKMDCFWQSIILQLLIGEKHAICEKFSDFAKKNIQCAFYAFKYYLTSLHKYSLHVKCYANFPKNLDFTQFLLLLWSRIRTKITARHSPFIERWLPVSVFIEPENWPPYSLDWNPVDYLVRTALHQMVYRHKMSDIDQLICVLVHCWTQLSQVTLNRVISQLSKRLIMAITAMGAHFEFFSGLIMCADDHCCYFHCMIKGPLHHPYLT